MSVSVTLQRRRGYSSEAGPLVLTRLFINSYLFGKEIGIPARVRILPAVLVAAVLCLTGVQAQSPQGSSRPTFRGGIDMVTINAVVRDHKGRIVQNLRRSDFEVFDNGQRRIISEFRSDRAPIALALLFDTSGSMRMAWKERAAREAAGQLLEWLNPGRDEVGVFAFDNSLRELQAFTRDGELVRGSFDSIGEPFGLTSLNDAIADTARRVAARGNSHRGLVVFTDGVDTNSRLTPGEVSGIASSIDVPVYIVAVVSPLDQAGTSASVVDSKAPQSGQLIDLAQWTGGELFMSSSPAQSGYAVKRIVDELRYHYLIAFEAAGKPGWHPLEVRLRDRHLSVRARGGYIAGPSYPGG
jgi:VWFA-related protein